ncbi:MAG: hypothetical protein ACRD0N_15670, partial [Acidimicrobiales bacterium]
AQARGDAALRRQAARSPAVFFAADLVWLEGHSAAPLPYRQRRSLLAQLDLSGRAWQTAPSQPGEGTALLAAAREQGLAGVVGRRLDGPYDTASLRLVPAGAT